MDRDRRLTGTIRGQIGNAEAPPGFELSNRWKVGSHKADDYKEDGNADMLQLEKRYS